MKVLLIILMIAVIIIILALLFATVFGIELINKAFEFIDKHDKG